MARNLSNLTTISNQVNPSEYKKKRRPANKAQVFPRQWMIVKWRPKIPSLLKENLQRIFLKHPPRPTEHYALGKIHEMWRIGKKKQRTLPRPTQAQDICCHQLRAQGFYIQFQNLAAKYRPPAWPISRRVEVFSGQQEFWLDRALGAPSPANTARKLWCHTVQI